MMTENQVGGIIVDAAIRVHTVLGPGLLESVYEAALALELTRRGLQVERQVPVNVEYEGVALGIGFRMDLLVNRLVMVELKSVESLTKVFKKQVLTYLKLTPLRLGYLINFNEARLVDGLVRIANGLPDDSPANPA